MGAWPKIKAWVPWWWMLGGMAAMALILLFLVKGKLYFTDWLLGELGAAAVTVAIVKLAGRQPKTPAP